MVDLSAYSMTLRHLRSFLAVADELNFSRAALRLFLSQPALSRQVKDLEENLGVLLFFRKPTGLQMTEEGQELYAVASQIIEQTDKALREMRLRFASPKQLLRIGFVPYGLSALALQAIRSSHPSSRLEFCELDPGRQLEGLREGTLDLAFFEALEPLRHDFSAVALHRSELMAVLSHDHPLARKKSIALSDLGSLTLLELKLSLEAPSQLARCFGREGLTPRLVKCANTTTALLHAIGAGEGATLLPAEAIHLPHPNVVFVRLRQPILVEFHAVFSSVRTDLSRSLAPLHRSNADTLSRPELQVPFILPTHRPGLKGPARTNSAYISRYDPVSAVKTINSE